MKAEAPVQESAERSAQAAQHVTQKIDGDGTSRDMRAGAVAQRKLQQAINNSPRAAQLKAFGNMMNDKPAAQAKDNLPDSLRSPKTMQLRMNFEASTRHLDNTSGLLPSAYYNPTYVATLGVAKSLDGMISVKQVESVSVGLGAAESSAATASYVPDTQEIHIRASNREKYADDPGALQQTLSGELGAFAHETEHATDHLSGKVPYAVDTQEGNENKIRTEWRAWAIEAAVATRNRQHGLITPNQGLLIASYESKQAFLTGYAWTRTKKYLQAYLSYSEMSEMRRFMQDHDAWIEEALDYYRLNLEYD